MIQVISHISNPKLEEMKVVYRRKQKERNPPVRKSCDLIPYLRKIWNDETIDLREELVIICLSGSHEVKGWIKLLEGGITSSNVDLRLLYGVVLSSASVSFILAHNHPSGNTTPSPEDIRLTATISEGARLLGLRLLDHIIISRNGHHSMCDNGELL